MPNKTISTVNDYGKTKITLKALMDARGLSRNALARSINTRFEVVDKWYENRVEKLDLDILARICYVLDCDVGDVLSYKK